MQKRHYELAYKANLQKFFYRHRYARAMRPQTTRAAQNRVAPTTFFANAARERNLSLFRSHLGVSDKQ